MSRLPEVHAKNFHGINFFFKKKRYGPASTVPAFPAFISNSVSDSCPVTSKSVGYGTGCFRVREKFQRYLVKTGRFQVFQFRIIYIRVNKYIESVTISDHLCIVKSFHSQEEYFMEKKDRSYKTLLPVSLRVLLIMLIAGTGVHTEIA